MYGKFGMASAICSMIVTGACVAQRPYKHEKSALKVAR